MQSCIAQRSVLNIEFYKTSSEGHQLTKLNSQEFKNETENNSAIILNSEKTYQKIVGFGGAFTESSAYLYSKLGQKNKEKILIAYFGENSFRVSINELSDFKKSDTNYNH